MDIIEEYFAEKKKAEALGVETNSIIGHGGWSWGKDAQGNETGWKQPSSLSLSWMKGRR